MLRRLKRGTFAVARHAGALDAWAATRWRRSRLAVICYHGVALADEHEWNPALYVTASFLRRRLELLRRHGYVVLGLEDAHTRLRDGTLPARAVVITFDDGTYDFTSIAWPILTEFGYPATVYWTTYYAQRQFPVFSVASRYVAWKGRQPLPALPPAMEEGSGAEKDAWLRDACRRLAVSYDAIAERRLFSIMRPEEVAALGRVGCDIQLHTHRHRMPLDEAGFRAEIDTNRAVIMETTGRVPRHFCYPSGRFRHRYLAWLESEGVLTATTTQPGLVEQSTLSLLMPRLVDHMGLSEAEFEAWMSGVAELLPHRTFWRDPDAGT